MKKQQNWGFWFFVAVVVAAISAAYWLAPLSVGQIELTVQSVFSLLALIFVITLFVERAQEVILTNWRALGSEQLDLKILALERQLQRLKTQHGEPQEIEAQFQALEAVRMEKLHYRAQTRVYAMRIGILIGVAVSLAGIRALGTLVPEAVLLGFSTPQQIIFYGVDVLITGGVIAGGSDGVHKMAELYRVFVETRSKEQKQKLSPLGE